MRYFTKARWRLVSYPSGARVWRVTMRLPVFVKADTSAVQIFATHFQNIEMTKCSATVALGMVGAGKIVATKFWGPEVYKFFKTKRK